MMWKKGDVIVRKPEHRAQWWANACARNGFFASHPFTVEDTIYDGEIFLMGLCLDAGRFELATTPSLNLEDYV